MKREYVAQRLRACLAPHTALFHGAPTIADTPATHDAILDLFDELMNEVVADVYREHSD